MRWLKPSEAVADEAYAIARIDRYPPRSYTVGLIQWAIRTRMYEGEMIVDGGNKVQLQYIKDIWHDDRFRFFGPLPTWEKDEP